MYACAHMLRTGGRSLPRSGHPCFLSYPQLVRIFHCSMDVYLSRRINMFSFLLSRGFTSWETWGETYIAENLLPTLIGFLELGPFKTRRD